MKFEARTNDSKSDLAAFVDWLRAETVSSLKRAYGSREQVDAAMFLFANRAYEAHLEETMIWEIAGESIAQADYTDEEADGVLSILEAHASLAAQVHSE